jgi:hypothetical protein
MLASLLERKKAYFILCLAIAATFIFPIVRPSSGWLYGISAVIDLIIFLIILQDLVEIFMNTHTINLFLALFFVYLSIDLVKLFDVAVNLHLGIIYYYFGLVSQMFFGVAFWFINVNTKSFKVRIKQLEDM